jgi:hypothetical protein
MLRKITFALIVTAAALTAQGSEKKSAAEASPNATQSPGGLIRDDRIAIENLSFWKKNATDGKGDYLEVSFDIVNKTEDPIPLKMFLIAFNEQDLVDKEYRRLVEYPKWRVFDEDKKMHKLVLFDSIPAIKHEDVAAFARQKEETVAKNGGFKPREDAEESTGSKKKTTLKQFLHYVRYVHENPNAGVDILLQGYENTNHSIKCASEAKTGKKCLEKKGAYLIEEKALKVNVWAKLLARYTVDKKFFNHLGLVLYDSESKKIVHRQFYSIKGRFKVY